MLTLPADVYAESEITAALGRYDSFVGQLEQGGEATEKNPEGYRHWQLYLENHSPIRFDTLRGLFPQGHFEPRHGTKAQAVAYVTKGETSLGHRIEHGSIDVTDRRGQRTDIEELRSAILEDGMTTNELLLADPRAFRYGRMLRELEAAREAARWQYEQREVVARYMWGPPGVGKTRMLFEQYEPGEVYRVTEYEHPFDSYAGQPVLALDEFASQLPFSLMLNVLDRYPLELPARYQNRWAAYQEVWVIANLPLEEQYESVAVEQPDRWAALRRRFVDVVEVGQEGWNPLLGC